MVSIKMFFTLAFALASHAYVEDLPARTVNYLDRVDSFGWIPAPTVAPEFDLVKRQGPPNPLCGYIEGNASQPLSCPNGYCGFASKVGGFDCCSSAVTDNGQNSLTGCSGLATSCAGLHDACDASCQSDSLVAFCTKSAYPYCFEIQFAGGGFSSFRCTDVSAFPMLTLEILSTVAGESSGSAAGQGAVASSTTDTVATSESTSSSSLSSSLAGSSSSSQGIAVPVPFTQTQQTGGGASTTQSATAATSSSGAGGMGRRINLAGLTLSLLGYWSFLL